MTEPSWQPDPTGRNHYRWWDGSNWSDSVSTNGQTSVDPIHAPAAPAAQAPVAQPTVPQAPVPPQPVAPAQPAFQQAAPLPPLPGTGGAPMGAAAAPAKKKNLLKWIIPAVAVVAVGAVLFFVFGRGDSGSSGSNKFGVTEAELKDGTSFVTLPYNLKQGDVIRVRVEPVDSELDTKVAVVTDSKTSKAFASAAENAFQSDGLTDVQSFFTDTADVFTDSDLGDLKRTVALQSIDVGFSGEADADFFVAFADGTYTVVVGSFDSSTGGKVRIIVEKLKKQVDIKKLDGLTDFEQFQSDQSDFFSDSDFFTSQDAFTP